MGAKMADQWVRLGMAIVIIALISIGLYQFSGRASAIEPTFSGNHLPALSPSAYTASPDGRRGQLCRGC